jgi:hypothetical protein
MSIPRLSIGIADVEITPDPLRLAESNCPDSSNEQTDFAKAAVATMARPGSSVRLRVAESLLFDRANEESDSGSADSERTMETERSEAIRRPEFTLSDKPTAEGNFKSALVERMVETEKAVHFRKTVSNSPERAMNEGDFTSVSVEKTELETMRPMLTPEPIDDPRAMEWSRAPVGNNDDKSVIPIVRSHPSDSVKALLKAVPPDGGWC